MLRGVTPYAVLLLSLLACTPPGVNKPPAVVTTPPGVQRLPPETVTVRDPELERRLARLDLQLWERDAQADELQQRLEEAQQEVVRAMAKVQSLATRAEAGSVMAEADVALQQLGLGAAGQQRPELRKGTELMEQSQAEFNKGNYGGAVYLANLSKTSVAAGRRRLGAIQGGALRQGEVLFAVPIALKASSRANVREGPGTSSEVVFTAESGTLLTGVSYQGEWVRVSDDGGRQGWVIRSLLSLR